MANQASQTRIGGASGNRDKHSSIGKHKVGAVPSDENSQIGQPQAQMKKRKEKKRNKFRS